MVHGPCGGVGADGSCEIGGPCAFVSSADQAEPLHLARASGEDASSLRVAPRAQVDPQPLLPGARAVLDRLLDPARPFVVADLPSPTADAEQDRALASRLAGSVDAVLLGDAPWARVMLPPAVRGWNVAREGVTPWCGVNARDRNRVALESEVAGLAAIGVPAMHSVTGDHPNLGHRPDAKPVFDLDSTELAALAARTTGLLISVAESPAAVPTKDRAARAAMKLSTGARVLFVNHCEPERLAEFAAELADVLSDPAPAGRRAATQPTPGEPKVPLIACIPLIPTRASPTASRSTSTPIRRPNSSTPSTPRIPSPPRSPSRFSTPSVCWRSLASSGSISLPPPVPAKPTSSPTPSPPPAAPSAPAHDRVAPTLVPRRRVGTPLQRRLCRVRSEIARYRHRRRQGLARSP